MNSFCSYSFLVVSMPIL